ncbi:MAG: Rrf2 family transcriptional regulator [bacterium]|nr:Rrf2 family transcriptional regulator [bacterium]
MAFFSTRTDYSLIMLRALASSKGFVSLRIVAKNNRLPYRYVSRLAGDMKKAGILKSREGVLGGYALAKKPKDIRLIDVIELLDGPMAPSRCTASPGTCPREAFCTLKPHWTTMHRKIHAQVSSYTLASIS